MRISDWSSDVCSSDLRLPPRALAVLNRWQAFNVLWRQQWHPASEDERGTRIVAIVVSLVAHLFFAVFLLYVAYVRIMALPEEAASAGEDVIQVEYIGEGTPDEEGGGPPPGEEVERGRAEGREGGGQYV